MKTVKLLVVSAILASFMAIGAMAQAPAAPKVGFINTQAFFFEKGGITRYLTEYKKITVEFDADEKGLTSLATRLNTLKKELETMQANKNVPIDQKVFNAKYIEFEKLGKEYKFKEEDYKTRRGRREAELFQPISQDIGNKIRDFAKSKGFDMVFDQGSLARDQSILYLNEQIDLTKQFIAYYNGLPAAATASK